MRLVSKEGGVRTFVPYSRIGVRCQTKLLYVILDRFLQQVKRLQHFRHLCNSGLRLDEGNELLAIRDLVFEHIACVLSRHFDFNRIVHGVNDFTQFPCLILQNLLRRLLIVTRFCMRGIHNDRCAL
ncbi:hypothetical protein D3C71_1615680 [compost metagenome]